MKLTELLNKITPLPWKSLAQHIYKEGTKGGNIASMSSPIKSSFVGFLALEIDDDNLEEAYSNKTYITHAANVLPELVIAAKDTADVIKALCEHLKEPTIRQEWIEILQPLEKAIARATEVKS